MDVVTTDDECNTHTLLTTNCEPPTADANWKLFYFPHEFDRKVWDESIRWWSGSGSSPLNNRHINICDILRTSIGHPPSIFCMRRIIKIHGKLDEHLCWKRFYVRHNCKYKWEWLVTVKSTYSRFIIHTSYKTANMRRMWGYLHRGCHTANWNSQTVLLFIIPIKCSTPWILHLSTHITG